MKAQLQIQEMAFMLVAVIFFFILVGLFAFSIVYSNIIKTSTSLSEDKTLLSINSLAESPEFYCEEQKPNCIDSDKLISLIGKKDYNNFWEFTSLRIIKLNAFNKSPEKDMIKCTLTNYPNCDNFLIIDKRIKNEKLIESYVTLCRKEVENNGFYDKCEIAKVIAGLEIKS